ncbi:MAG TPA: histidine triad nucleotide-binding protein [Gammaproteobacteria bacterium]|nr:histidine triad nucleotide-binding protein [Gammaproteobacteria bacterium]
MSDCLFCKMVSGEIQPDTVYEDDDILAFNDINPHAPTHVLIIPKRHIATLNDTSTDDTELMGRLTMVATGLAKEAGFADDGYRIVMNCNSAAGQSVFHIHMHLLAGRSMSWPPG